MDRRVRGVLRRAADARRKARQGLPLARIISREDWVSAAKGGPGYWYALKLRAGRKGAGRLLGETDGWGDQLQDRMDELKQLAADLGYRVIADEAPAVLECPA